MVTASELKEGMAHLIDRQVYRVMEVAAKTGATQMGGTVKVRLTNVRSGRMWDQHFRLLERLENVDLEKRKVEFLYNHRSACVFQRLDTFEQFEISSEGLGLAELLQQGTEVPAEFFENEPISIELPEAVEARVVATAPPARSQQGSGRKKATLENGLVIQAPLFVAPGEIVSIDSKTSRYLERVRTQRKEGA